ncbi:hypothetical protein V2J09_020309 [Rumex salicifolius]
MRGVLLEKNDKQTSAANDDAHCSQMADGEDFRSRRGDEVGRIQWLLSRVEINGYEEYSGTDYRSAGCTEEYTVIRRDLEQAGEEESLKLEGDIGGGLFFERQISIQKDKVRIERRTHQHCRKEEEDAPAGRRRRTTEDGDGRRREEDAPAGRRIWYSLDSFNSSLKLSVMNRNRKEEEDAPAGRRRRTTEDGDGRRKMEGGAPVEKLGPAHCGREGERERK